MSIYCLVSSDFASFSRPGHLVHHLLCLPCICSSLIPVRGPSLSSIYKKTLTWHTQTSSNAVFGPSHSRLATKTALQLFASTLRHAPHSCCGHRVLGLLCSGHVDHDSSSEAYNTDSQRSGGLPAHLVPIFSLFSDCAVSGCTVGMPD